MEVNNPKEGYHEDKVIHVFLKIFLCKCEACLQVIFLVLLWLNFIFTNLACQYVDFLEMYSYKEFPRSRLFIQLNFIV